MIPGPVDASMLNSGIQLLKCSSLPSSNIGKIQMPTQPPKIPEEKNLDVDIGTDSHSEISAFAPIKIEKKVESKESKETKDSKSKPSTHVL
jgi:hypothetical protein